VTRDGADLYVQARRGTLHFNVVPRFHPPDIDQVAGGLTAPMPGIVLEVRAAPGDSVTKGTTLIVLEAMKMEHHIGAPADGVVTEVLVAAGEQVANGAPLLVLEPTDD
jgi:propionyl-CoA carboxylase alpha chain